MTQPVADLTGGNFLGTRIDRATLAHSGAGDLGLYAAPATAFTGPSVAAPLGVEAIFARADAAPDSLASFDLTPGRMDYTGGLLTPSISAPDISGRLDGNGAGTEAQSSQSPVSGSPVASEQTVHDAVSGPFADAPTLPSNIVQSPVAADQQLGSGAPTTASDVVTVPLPEAMTAVQASAATLQDALATLTQQMEAFSTAQALATPIDAVQQGTGALIDQITSLAEHTTAAVSPLINQLAETTAQILPDMTAGPLGTVETTLETAQGFASDLVAGATSLMPTVHTATQIASDSAQEIVANVTTSVAQMIASPVDFATHGLDTITEPLLSTTPALVGAMPGALEATVSGIIPPVVESVGELTGTNPAAGIATLTSLVSAADMFGVHDDGPAINTMTAGTGALDLVDMLVDDDSADALLGTGSHEDGLLGGLGGHDNHHGSGLDLGLG